MLNISTNLNDRNCKSNMKLYARALSLVLIALVIITPAVFADGEAGVYDHLMSDTFEYTNTSTPQARLFEEWAKFILSYLLPFMTIFGVLNMVVSMASSVIYLSKPDFFDEVHILHYLRRQKTMAVAAGGGAMSRWLKTMKELGLKDGILKGLIIPDFKAYAFADASEIGEDGRPSLGTFLKNKFPKFAALLAMIIMISDKTLMRIHMKSAEVGVWFFKKAESYDYIKTLERASNMGKNYSPVYKGGKKKIFSSLYSVALALDKSQGTEQSEYKQKVGALVDKWVTEKFANVDFNTVRVATSAKAVMYPVMTQDEVVDGGTTTYQIPVQTFNVRPENGESHIVLEVALADRKSSAGISRVYKTNDPAAWSGSGTEVVLDITKLSEFVNKDLSKDVIDDVYTSQEVVIAGKTKSIQTTVEGTTVRVSLGDENYQAFSFKLHYRFNGMNKERECRYANPNYKSEETNKNE